MKHTPFAFVAILTQLLLAAPETFVHHPQPKDPIYLKQELYPDIKKRLPLPPAPESAQQKADEKKLLEFQSRRSEKDCERAKEEIFVGLGNFFGNPRGPLSPETAEKLAPFFEQLRNDGDFFIQKLKKDFPRQRPFLYVKGVSPCIPKEVTGAYPSGHAVLSELFALVLTDLYPDQENQIKARAKQIAEDRVLAGMHHPSDIEAGQKLGALLYTELKRSPKFQSEFAKLTQ